MTSLARPPPDPSGPLKAGEGKHISIPDESSIYGSPPHKGEVEFKSVQFRFKQENYADV